jgi:hypothetical protein
MEMKRFGIHWRRSHPEIPNTTSGCSATNSIASATSRARSRQPFHPSGAGSHCSPIDSRSASSRQPVRPKGTWRGDGDRHVAGVWSVASLSLGGFTGKKGRTIPSLRDRHPLLIALYTVCTICATDTNRPCLYRARLHGATHSVYSVCKNISRWRRLFLADDSTEGELPCDVVCLYWR